MLHHVAYQVSVISFISARVICNMSSRLPANLFIHMFNGATSSLLPEEISEPGNLVSVSFDTICNIVFFSVQILAIMQFHSVIPANH